LLACQGTDEQRPRLFVYFDELSGSVFSEDDNAVTQTQELVDVAGGHQEGRSATSQVSRDSQDFLFCTDIHAGGGLFEEENARASAKPSGKQSLLLVTSTERSNLSMESRRADAQLGHLPTGKLTRPVPAQNTTFSESSEHHHGDIREDT